MMVLSHVCYVLFILSSYPPSHSVAEFWEAGAQPASLKHLEKCLAFQMAYGKSLPKSLPYLYFCLWKFPKFVGVLYINSFIFWIKVCLENLLCATHCVPGIRDRDMKLCFLIYYKCQCELLVLWFSFTVSCSVLGNGNCYNLFGGHPAKIYQI